jgi:DNA replication and repair protein RecF
MLDSFALKATDSPFSSVDHITRLSIARVSLTCFRSYTDHVTKFLAAPVVITGANGAGKTNLLEAISLLVPGRGLRRAELTDLQNRFHPSPWAVAIKLRNGDGELSIGTGRDASTENDGERRLVHIDGRSVRGRNTLADHVAMTWITPAMDRLLAEGASTRRKWFDRLAFSFDPAHGGRVTRYEKAMRERLKLLRDGVRDQHWLSALENDMAQTAVAIAAARRQLLNQLRGAVNETSGVFPRADLALRGIAEDLLDTTPALLIEDRLRDALAAARVEDAYSGTCSVGVHRTDLVVIHRAKNCPADLCSTGEQKALMIAIMLAYIRTLIDARAMTPIVLLDDIVAHLDDTRRKALFGEILVLGVQAWMTGTDTKDFASLLPDAQLVEM